ncbi:tumor necrosis factor receptor superfamily member 1B [Labeo rohita]|uniref:tumor necrosis factor receptor superfamily member 1B n=1 Tax=Labeo rohita TaxID=84645 RepID=UPI0021E1E198|nr:tumor necrosis factor receptor superfamily member 1B [Labeo rohita]
MLILVSRLLLMAAVWRVAEGKMPVPYNSEGECHDKSSEYYERTVRLCCSKCKPGTHLTVTCTSSSDTICEPCQDGHYLENVNYSPNCFSCPKCKDVKGLMYGKECSADTKAVCVCKPGMFCFRNFGKECEECKTYRSCKPGEYVLKKGSPTSDVKCARCPPGTFSNHSNSEQCKPHTECESGSVLRLGDSTTDKLCKMTPTIATTTKAPLWSTRKHVPSNVPSSAIMSETQETQGMITTTTIITTSLLPLSSTNPSLTAKASASGAFNQNDMIFYTVISVTVLVVLILLVLAAGIYILRKRKGLRKVPITDINKVEQDTSASGTPDCQHLLSIEKGQKEPSMTSSDSQSQHGSSHSSTDWLERTSQEEYIPEQPSISSPMVNVSITATFQLNQTTAALSNPLSTPAWTPHVEAPVPLSQEEVCISCQQEDGKEALRSVQESGLCVI